MSEKIYARGNFGTIYPIRNQGASTQGMGTQQSNTCLGYSALIGDEQHPQYLQAVGTLSFKVDQGIWFQAVGCDIDVDFTLEPSDYALSKEANDQGLVHWCNTLPVKKDTIVESEIRGFSVIRATFHGRGILYMVAR